jgi:hypothetical protein
VVERASVAVLLAMVPCGSSARDLEDPKRFVSAARGSASRRSRRGGRWMAEASASGIGVALGSSIALLVSQQAPLFGFREVGSRQAIVISIVLEVAATLLLGAFMVGLLRGGRERQRAAAILTTAAPVIHRDVP